MKQSIVAALVGVVFALGLALGGMTDPAKVIGFLDVFGAWDPSLAFVMGGAIAVYAPVLRWARRRPAPLLDERFHLPTRSDIDARLLIGAAMFGVGWGLAGYCPGPALVGSMALGSDAVVFAGSMLLGMAGLSAWQHAARRSEGGSR